MADGKQGSYCKGGCGAWSARDKFGAPGMDSATLTPPSWVRDGQGKWIVGSITWQFEHRERVLSKRGPHVFGRSPNAVKLARRERIKQANLGVRS